jgi:Zn-dependent peptidase ImmA (M78 family)
MKIRTLPDLKRAYGSYNQAALALGVTRQALHRRIVDFGNLPAGQYFRHKAILEGHGHTVEPSLWGFAEADQRETAG